jgi:hypothetical protein
MFTLFILTFTALAYAGVINQCNECAPSVSVSTPSQYKVSYVQCTFDSTFSVTHDTPVDWLFIGTACDDRCPGLEIGEGYFCSKPTVGTPTNYYEVDDGVLGKSFHKLEFHHYNCSTTPSGGLSLHVHRFLPNYGIKNTSIPYFVTSGQKESLSLANPVSFSVHYP